MREISRDDTMQVNGGQLAPVFPDFIPFGWSRGGFPSWSVMPPALLAAIMRGPCDGLAITLSLGAAPGGTTRDWSC